MYTFLCTPLSPFHFCRNRLSSLYIYRSKSIAAVVAFAAYFQAVLLQPHSITESSFRSATKLCRQIVWNYENFSFAKENRNPIISRNLTYNDSKCMANGKLREYIYSVKCARSRHRRWFCYFSMPIAVAILLYSTTYFMIMIMLIIIIVIHSIIL